ncbi:hypothetical protein [Streptomyces boncukensis]|uniref:Uncharacterized protein n=1 Tax=Streptomyces boncukensis TaxID=2711219 RepID=A0A6G4X8J2_9ACTN|nr:hypothetical protein [Streptomyces boncukensis]NGO72981.1 hypothetical protein [Streptomyces boncukensis]
MTGPDHYREAERLATMARCLTRGSEPDPVAGAAVAAEAQVHATLALAAATAMQAPVDGCEPGMSGLEWAEWRRAINGEPAGGDA